MRMSSSILAQRDRLPLENGMELRLLSALEVLQARREAKEMAQGEQELPLCANACLIARALEKAEDRSPVFESGREVLAGMTVREIEVLAERWSGFSQESDPGLEMGERELEQLKKNSGMTEENG